MLFRNKLTGLLVEINRRDYKNDTQYYKKIGLVTGLGFNNNSEINSSSETIGITKPIITKYSAQAIERLITKL